MVRTAIISSSDGQIRVVAPMDPLLNADLRQLGAKWSGRPPGWWVAESAYPRVLVVLHRHQYLWAALHDLDVEDPSWAELMMWSFPAPLRRPIYDAIRRLLEPADPSHDRLYSDLVTAWVRVVGAA